MLAQLGLGLTCLKLSLACFEICWEIFLHICNGYEIIVFTKGRVPWNLSFNLFDSDKDTVITKFPYSAYCYVFISNSADNVGQTYLGIHAKLSCWTQRMRRAQNWNEVSAGTSGQKNLARHLKFKNLNCNLKLEIETWNLAIESEISAGKSGQRGPAVTFLKAGSQSVAVSVQQWPWKVTPAHICEHTRNWLCAAFS